MSPARIGIDTGGTFTDCVLADEKNARLTVLKVPSDPADPSNAIVAGIIELSIRSGVPLHEISAIAHGTTVATNAMLEGKWGRVGLITTRGFRDVLEIGTQMRPQLYALQSSKPEPLVPRDLVIELDERIAADGTVVDTLDPEAAERAVRRQKSDVARFEKLGVIPNMTPITAQANDWTLKVIAPPLGAARMELMYPIGDLAASSVPLSFGSDWPVATEKPLEGMSTAITRQTPEGYPDGGWIPSQRISLDQAIRAHTYGPAYQAGREHEAGLLQVGMVADLCQVGQDLYTVAPLDLPQVPVLGTWIDGRRQDVS